jgi:protein O-mannosyl-transferase
MWPTASMSASPAQLRPPVLLLPLALGLLAYLGALGAGFVWDDTHLIVGNTLLRQASPFPTIVSDFWQEGERTDFYRPLVSLSYFLEFRLWRLAPSGYHAANLAYHLLATLAVTWAGWLLFASPVAAGLSGAVFAVHPIHTESVAFISGRPDLIAGALLVAAFAFYVRARTRQRSASAVSVALFVGALLSKEAALALPAILIAYELTLGLASDGPPRPGWTVGRWARGLGAAVWPYLAGAAAYLALRALVLGAVLGRGGDRTRFATRGVIALNALGEYLRLLLVPYPATPDRLPNPAIGGATVLALAALALLLGAALASWRWSRMPAFLLAWFFLALVPASPLVPGRAPQVAERFLYIPSVAWAWGLGWLGARVWSSPWLRPRVRRGLAVGLAVVLAVGAVALTGVRVRDWRDEESLFRRMSTSEPRSYLAPLNLGHLSFRAGQLPEAEAEFRRALALRPHSAAALLGLALVESRRGNHDRAIQDAVRARDLAPDGDVVHLQLGAIYGLAGRYPEAAASFREAVRRNPRRLQARGNLVAALADAGQPAAARAALAELAGRLTTEAYPDPEDAEMVSALAKRLAGARKSP